MQTPKAACKLLESVPRSHSAKNSCAFIGTDDLGRVYSDGTFEVIGRVDSSDVRGCNLMVS